jgi:hypothetical protein
VVLAHAAVFGFLISSAYALTTPYVLARTGSALTLGLLTALMSVGGVAGAILIGAWGGLRRRIDTILLAMLLVLAATVLFGLQLPTLVLGAALFVAMMGVTCANTTAMTLLQAKVPGALQGRVFAVFTQLSLALTPLGYLMIGPLADRAFTPLANSASWAAGVLGRLFGTGAAGGMGGLFALTAGLGVIATLVTYGLPSVRRLEESLPTYRSAADASVASTTEPAEAGLWERYPAD